MNNSQVNNFESNRHGLILRHWIFQIRIKISEISNNNERFQSQFLKKI